MRGLRASRWLQNAYNIAPYSSSRFIPRIARNGYCSACDSDSSKLDTAKTSPKPKAAKTISKPKATSNTDHRQLAIEQELFFTSPYSPGSPLFLPNGTRIFNTLTSYLRSKYNKYGFQEVITPIIYKKSLWEKSGHWQNYAEDMYSVVGRGAKGETDGKEIGDDEEYGLKPMNCPGHCLIFASKQRSYRDLPIRFADFSPLHRNEVSGSLSGLTRLRKFHQDDGHIFCRPSQIGAEISKTIEFVQETYKTLGLGRYRMTLSTRPEENYLGSSEEWDFAEGALKKSLDASGTAWTVNPGDGAFYGPKIDIIIEDPDGKEHQTATIQLDFQLPKRFELEYQCPAPEYEKKGITTTNPEALAVNGLATPVLIHRAVLGSVERIMALLIEHHQGKWPFWLSPRQVVILTINDTPPVLAFAESIKQELTAPLSNAHDPITVSIDQRAVRFSAKLAEARSKGYSVILTVGREDVLTGKVTCNFERLPEMLQKKLAMEHEPTVKGKNGVQYGFEPEALRNLLRGFLLLRK